MLTLFAKSKSKHDEFWYFTVLRAGKYIMLPYPKIVEEIRAIPLKFGQCIELRWN